MLLLQDEVVVRQEAHPLVYARRHDRSSQLLEELSGMPVLIVALSRGDPAQDETGGVCRGDSTHAAVPASIVPGHAYRDMLRRQFS